MLTVNAISKSYGIEKILDGVSFTVNPGERLGLVGPNGCGKTTLLRILAGLEQPDAGSVRLSSPGLPVGYLPQGSTPPAELTLTDAIARLVGDLPAQLLELERLSVLLADDPDNRHNQEAYDMALGQVELLTLAEQKSATIFSALGLGNLPGDMHVRNLSGGQKTRLALAGLLLSIPPHTPSLLLLDEPTNHLDLEMLEWLEDWLLSPSLSHFYGILLVSHDRAFLDNVATGILELDLQTHKLRAYPGNYTQYLETKLIEMERHRQEYTDQQEEIGRLRAAITRVRSVARFKPGGKADSGDKFAKGFFANRSKGTIRRAKHLEHRLESLLADERIEKPKSEWQMKLEFEPSRRGGKDVLVLDDLAIGYGQNVLLSQLDLTVRHGARVAIVGPNGAGKTTLLRTIAGMIPALGGRLRLGSAIQLGYMSQEQEDLPLGWDALETILHDAAYSETDARAFLHKFLFSGDDVFMPVRSLSYGERARLSLACLVVRGCNLLLLDEPINHLDIPSRSRFEAALAVFEGSVLAVVHDRYFIQGFATEIWEIQEGQLARHILRDQLLI